MNDKLMNLTARMLQLSQLHRAAHWMVTGPRFHSLHLYFEELVHKTDNWADELAERLLFLGGRPPLRLEEVVALAPQEDLATDVPGQDMLGQVHAAWQDVREQLLSALEAAESARDRVTITLLDGMLEEVESQLWKQRQTLA